MEFVEGCLLFYCHVVSLAYTWNRLFLGCLGESTVGSLHPYSIFLMVVAHFLCPFGFGNKRFWEFVHFVHIFKLNWHKRVHTILLFFKCLWDLRRLPP